MDAIQRHVIDESDAIVLAESGNAFVWATHRLRFAAPGRYRASTGGRRDGACRRRRGRRGARRRTARGSAGRRRRDADAKRDQHRREVRRARDAGSSSTTAATACASRAWRRSGCVPMHSSPRSTSLPSRGPRAPTACALTHADELDAALRRAMRATAPSSSTCSSTRPARAPANARNRGLASQLATQRRRRGLVPGAFRVPLVALRPHGSQHLRHDRLRAHASADRLRLPAPPAEPRRMDARQPHDQAHRRRHLDGHGLGLPDDAVLPRARARARRVPGDRMAVRLSLSRLLQAVPGVRVPVAVRGAGRQRGRLLHPLDQRHRSGPPHADDHAGHRRRAPLRGPRPEGGARAARAGLRAPAEGRWQIETDTIYVDAPLELGGGGARRRRAPAARGRRCSGADPQARDGRDFLDEYDRRVRATFTVHRLDDYVLVEQDYDVSRPRRACIATRWC